jgi:hypothetical protein
MDGHEATDPPREKEPTNDNRKTLKCAGRKAGKRANRVGGKPEKEATRLKRDVDKLALTRERLNRMARMAGLHFDPVSGFHYGPLRTTAIPLKFETQKIRLVAINIEPKADPPSTDFPSELGYAMHIGVSILKVQDLHNYAKRKLDGTLTASDRVDVSCYQFTLGNSKEPSLEKYLKSRIKFKFGSAVFVDLESTRKQLEDLLNDKAGPWVMLAHNGAMDRKFFKILNLSCNPLWTVNTEALLPAVLDPDDWKEVRSYGPNPALHRVFKATRPVSPPCGALPLPHSSTFHMAGNDALYTLMSTVGAVALWVRRFGNDTEEEEGNEKDGNKKDEIRKEKNEKEEHKKQYLELPETMALLAALDAVGVPQISRVTAQALSSKLHATVLGKRKSSTKDDPEPSTTDDSQLSTTTTDTTKVDLNASMEGDSKSPTEITIGEEKLDEKGGGGLALVECREVPTAGLDEFQTTK